MMFAGDLGYWLGSHIFLIILVGAAVRALVESRDKWAPSLQAIFRAIGPGLAQLTAWRQPPEATEELDRQLDWDFWLKARDHGTPAEQAIAPAVLETLGYQAPPPAPVASPHIEPELTERQRLLDYMRTTTSQDGREDAARKLVRLDFEGMWGYRGTRDEMSEDLTKIAKALLTSAQLRKVCVRDGAVVRLTKGGEALVRVEGGRVTVAHPSGAIGFAERQDD